MYQHGDFKENDIVVGMLEAIEAKLCGLKSDTKAAEATAQKEYNSLMTKSKVDKASKSASIEHKTAKKRDEEHALETNKNDLKALTKNSMQLSPISINSSQVALTLVPAMRTTLHAERKRSSPCRKHSRSSTEKTCLNVNADLTK